MQRRELFEKWKQVPQKNRVSVIADHIIRHYNVDSVTTVLKKTVNKFSKKICEQFRYRWTLKGRSIEQFEKFYSVWMDQSIEIPENVKDLLKPTSSAKASGRPTKNFGESSSKSKKRKVESLVESFTPEELTFAAETSVRASGKRDAAKLIHDALASPKRPKKYKTALVTVSAPTVQRSYSTQEALAFFINNKLTVNQYKNIRAGALERGHDIYPSYKKIYKEKIACCPTLNEIIVTEESVECNLQSLIDHTVDRLCNTLQNVIERLDNKLILYCKWGCDGSSGHSLYKQKMTAPTGTDEYLLSIALVPVRLCVNNDRKTLVWQNPRPSSTQYCRPVKLLFQKETTQLLQQEYQSMQIQIRNLRPTKIEFENSLEVLCDLSLTMVDTKVCNAITETKSSQKCYICGATSKEMNTEKVLDKIPNEDYYKFGISSLHAYIRCMECLLNISYRLQLQMWQIRGEENKTVMKAKKKEIHDKFLRETGMHIDEPKQTAGNTNDGNTARRFFADPNLTSRLTGLNQDLIRKLGIILRTISSGYEIDTDKFGIFCSETKELYLIEYSWYPMPVTLHKILIHGSEIIKSFLIPIGQMSEEAQEARNKELRKVREHHTRKISRVATNMDMFKYLLMTSDPLIASYRSTPPRISKSFPKEVLNLLRNPNL